MSGRNEEFVEKITKLPEYIEFNKLSKDLEKLKKKLPSLRVLPAVKYISDMPEWSEYIRKSDRIRELIPKLVEKIAQLK